MEIIKTKIFNKGWNSNSEKQNINEGKYKK